jgi:hypothetical protein
MQVEQGGDARAGAPTIKLKRTEAEALHLRDNPAGAIGLATI